MKTTLKSIILTVVAVAIVAIPFTVIAQNLDQNPGYPQYAQFPSTDGFETLLPSGDQANIDLNPGYPHYAQFPAPEWDSFETLVGSNENQPINMWPGYPQYANFECASGNDTLGIC